MVVHDADVYGISESAFAIQDHFGVHWSEDRIIVRIRFDKAVADFLRRRRWHPSRVVEDRPDGPLLFSLTVIHLLELKRRILSWGDMAKVLETDNLVADIVRTVMVIGTYYGTP